MNLYELTIVLAGKVSSAKRKSFEEKLEKTLKDLKGKVLRIDDRGEIELAYKIKKNTSGVFLHFDLELPQGSLKSLKDRFKLEEGIIRYLIVKSNR